MTVDAPLTDSNFFCIIGAQRCGTSWLYKMLDAHASITMASPMRPEPKYFLNDVVSKSEYLNRYFPFLEKAQWIGEKGTSYIEHPRAAMRIISLFPKAKVIVVLRNPTYRAISNYHFSVKHGLETRSLREVFLEQKEKPVIAQNVSVSPFDYLGRSNYIKHLAPWASIFQDRLKVLIYEQLLKNPEKLQELYEWIGVDRTVIPKEFHSVVNATEPTATMEECDDVTKTLNVHFKQSIQDLENWIGTKIEEWHDPIQ